MTQHLEALARASKIRSENAVLKRQVKEGTVSVMSAIVSPSTRNLYVIDVLAWHPQWGTSTAEKALQRLSIRPTVLCGSLTARERSLISKWMRGSRSQRRSVESNARRAWAA